MTQHHGSSRAEDVVAIAGGGWGTGEYSLGAATQLQLCVQVESASQELDELREMKEDVERRERAQATVIENQAKRLDELETLYKVRHPSSRRVAVPDLCIPFMSAFLSSATLSIAKAHGVSNHIGPQTDAVVRPNQALGLVPMALTTWNHMTKLCVLFCAMRNHEDGSTLATFICFESRAHHWVSELSRMPLTRHVIASAFRSSAMLDMLYLLYRRSASAGRSSST